MFERAIILKFKDISRTNGDNPRNSRTFQDKEKIPGQRENPRTFQDFQGPWQPCLRNVLYIVNNVLQFYFYRMCLEKKKIFALLPHVQVKSREFGRDIKSVSGMVLGGTFSS